jgi:hypothetical protein
MLCYGKAGQFDFGAIGAIADEIDSESWLPSDWFES